jgi:peroxiredoxin
MGPASSNEGEEHRLVGVQAPAFDLKGESGAERVSIADGSGKVMIVDFWATWCKPCKESFPFYQGLVDKHGDQLVMIGISVDDEPDGIADFAKQTGAKFPLAWDDGKALSRQYGPPTMPTSYIVDRNGIVRYVHVGFKAGSAEEIEAKVDSLLK